MSTVRNAVVLLVAVIVLPVIVHAQSVQRGSVVSAETGEPIGGALVRAAGTTRGTYTNSRGTFKLPLQAEMKMLEVRSIGYAATTLPANTSADIVIRLQPSDVRKKTVEVVGNIQADEIIKRAIAHAVTNDERLRTMESTTYSKLYVNMDAPILGSSATAAESIMETFSKVYYRRNPTRTKRVHIVQRRQTRNIPSANNLAVFDEFFNLTQPEVNLLNTRLVSPLSSNALNTYTYRIAGKRMLGDKLVYDLEFEPQSHLFPGFAGTLSIVDGTYQAISADFAITESTAIPFVTGLKIKQQYEPISDSIWVPMYQQMSGEVHVQLLAGIASVSLGASAETYVTEVQVNHTIADSLLQPAATSAAELEMKSGSVQVRMVDAHKVVTVDKDADTSKSEYWETHSFSEMSDAEREVYRVADSVAAATPASSDTAVRVQVARSGLFSLALLPQITRTTITRWAFGLEAEIGVGPAAVTPLILWGSNSSRIANLGVSVQLLEGTSTNLKLTGHLFSDVQTVQPRRMILGGEEVFNLNHILFMEYHDYYRREGWDAGVGLQSGAFTSALSFEWSRHRADSVLTNVPHPIVAPDVGNYQVVRAAVSWNIKTGLTALLGSEPPLKATIQAVAGLEVTTDRRFATLGATVGYRLETIETGYQPMRLDIDVSATTTLTDWVPVQYRGSLLRRYPAFGSTTDLATVPTDRYGGTSAIVLHAEHNFSDVWWRAIGLPVFAGGRGTDLIVQFGAGIAKNTLPEVLSVWQATPTPYMEAGFALSRIPSFISDLVTLRFDALWPVGGLASAGSFGWSVGVSTPW